MNTQGAHVFLDFFHGKLFCAKRKGTSRPFAEGAVLVEKRRVAGHLRQNVTFDSGRLTLWPAHLGSEDWTGWTDFAAPSALAALVDIGAHEDAAGVVLLHQIAYERGRPRSLCAS